VANEPTTTSARKISPVAIARTVMWAASFSRAIRRRVIGAAATNSRLPRRASAAKVPDRARIDHRLAISGKNVPYLYWR
jgi:hypothetical protein